MNKESREVQDFIRMISQTHVAFRQAVQRHLKERNVDLTFEMLQILMQLWRKQGVNQQDLANQTFKDKASMTFLMNNMEKRNLVERKEDAIDRRSKLVYLTAEGENICMSIIPSLQDIYTALSRKINSNQIQPSLNFLVELRDLLIDI